MDFLEIDGSAGSGGGQIIRVAVGLSAVTQKPIRITNIRQGRTKPGLRPQHLKGIEAVAQLSNARISGFSEGSTEIEFYPGELAHDHLRVDVGTAGSIGLVFQSLMIPAVHTEMPLEFEVTGGTDVSWSPSVTYFREVFLNTLKKMGIESEVQIQEYGFYPKGGGRVILNVHPGRIRPINLYERRRIQRHDIISVATEDLEKAEVAERQAHSAREVLGRKSEIESKDYVQAQSTGSSLHAHTHFENTVLGTTVLGKRGVKAEDVGKECAQTLLKQVETGACLDRWMGDQILPFMAFAPGTSRISVPEVSNHAKTSMELIERFLPIKFSAKESGDFSIIKSERL